MITSGRLTWSSYPSRRIDSMRTASWSSPRPATSMISGDDGGADANRDVAEHLALETLPDLAGCDEACRPRPESGDVFTPNVIRSTGSSTSSRGRASGSIGIGERVADLNLGEAGDHEQIAGDPLADVDSPRPAKPSSWVTPAPQRRLLLVGVTQRHLLPAPERPFDDAADCEPAEVLGRIEIGDERLQRSIRVAGRCRDGGDDGVEQGGEVGIRRRACRCRRRARPSRATDGHDGELDVLVRRLEIEEELVDLVDDGLRSERRADRPC